MPKTLAEILDELKEDLGQVNAPKSAHDSIQVIVTSYQRRYVPQNSKNGQKAKGKRGTKPPDTNKPEPKTDEED